MKKQIVALLAGAMLLVGMAQYVGATTLVYTDNLEVPASGGNAITYSLTYNLLSNSTYDATFSVSHLLDTSPEWYASWFTFNFSTANSSATIGSLVGPASTGPWSILTSATEVLGGGENYKNPLDTGAAGFYVTSIASPTPDYPTEGIWLTGADLATKTFNFQFTTNGGTLHDDDMPFKVGYYKDGDTKWTVNQLSKELVVAPVPEPGTMMLFGIGMLGLAVYGKRRMNKEA